MDANRMVYINGDLLPEPEAKISIFDVGLMYGVTLYESLRTFRHKWWLAHEHWKRLKRSLGYAGMTGLVTESQ